MQQLPNLPYKGTQDYFPGDYQKLQYIFSIWRKVCERYGYKEYLTPVLEPAAIYEAKSGEDIASELYTLTDRGDRRLSLRPEMTPSVTRMVTRIYSTEPKPIRLFSIANFFRAQKPQKGRTREFWQLNFDIFGAEETEADIEIVMMMIDIMLAFRSPEGSFVLKLNNRKLIDFFFEEVLAVKDQVLKAETTRKMDKYDKMSSEDFEKTLADLGLDKKQIKAVVAWMSLDLAEMAKEIPSIVGSEGYQEVEYILSQLQNVGYGKWAKFAPDMIRGFDYYDGSIFEVFATGETFKRSLFGGGRYNGLAELFGSQDIPAVGCAPGDVPTAIFLDENALWPDFDLENSSVFLPVLEGSQVDKYLLLAMKLRQEGKLVEMSAGKMTIRDALSYASKKGFKETVIYGTEEMEQGKYKMKDMRNGEERVEEIA